MRVVAPILPHLAEDVWQNLPFEYNINNDDVSKFVLESVWPTVMKDGLPVMRKKLILGVITKVTIIMSCCHNL